MLVQLLFAFRCRCGELCCTRLPVRETTPQTLLCWRHHHAPAGALDMEYYVADFRLTPPPPRIFDFFPNFKCLWGPPRLVRSSSPSGYILPRSPPVAYWVGFFIFFKVSFEKHTSGESPGVEVRVVSMWWLIDINGDCFSFK